MLNENLAELRELAQEAFEDAVLMGCDERQVREVLAGSSPGSSTRIASDVSCGIRSAAVHGAGDGRAPMRCQLGAGRDDRRAGGAASRARQDHRARLQIRRAGRQPVRFGTLSICVRDCEKSPPEERRRAPPSSRSTSCAPGEARVRLFSGWMFASSPALSALEHPVYDVNLLDCRKASGSADGAGGQVRGEDRPVESARRRAADDSGRG